MDVAEAQRAVVRRMLRLHNNLSADNSPNSPINNGLDDFGAEDADWKVLVYDAHCRDILAPLFNVRQFRDLGVTLNLMLNTQRERVPDVPAVYFVAPTKANIERICDDMKRSLYDSFHLHFASHLPRELLELLAQRTTQDETAHKIARVFDQYADFIAFERSLISLNLDSAFQRLNDPQTDEQAMTAICRDITESLFSVCVSLCCVPVIRASPGHAAAMIAQQLHRRLAEHLVSRGNLFANAPSHDQLPFAQQRPVLILLDRAVDLTAALHHTCTYQALAHDLLSLKANRLRVHKSTFDLDRDADSFWAQYAGAPFPNACEAQGEMLQSYQTKSASITNGAVPTADGLANATQQHDPSSLAAAVESIPELQRQKRLLDTHTAIMSAIAEQLKERDLSTYYMLEEAFMKSRNHHKDRQQLLAQLVPEKEGSPMDKLRLFMIYLLCCPDVSAEESQQAESHLRDLGCDLTSLQELKKIKALSSMSSLSLGRSEAPASSESNWFDALKSQVQTTGSGLLAGVKSLLPSTEDVPVTKIVRALMDNRPDPPQSIQRYITLDPKQSRDQRTAGTQPFHDAIVFMVGGGNYVEFQNLENFARQKASSSSGSGSSGAQDKRIVYGCTDLINAEEFVQQLGDLGRQNSTPTLDLT